MLDDVCAQRLVRGSRTGGRGGENGTRRASAAPGSGCRRCVSENGSSAHVSGLLRVGRQRQEHARLWARGEGRGAAHRVGATVAGGRGDRRLVLALESDELAAGNSVWLAPLLRLRRQQRAKSAWRTEGVGWVGECERWAAHVGRAGPPVHHRRRRSGADHRVHVATFM